MSVAVATQSTQTRWDAALSRARNEGIRLRAGSAAGRYQVISNGHTYDTTADTCTCMAALNGDPICKHRAAVRSAERMANAAKPVTCTECRGHGWISTDGGWSAFRCLNCGGAGTVPALRIVVANDDSPEPTPPAAPGSRAVELNTELAELTAELERNHERLYQLNGKMERQGGRLSDRDFAALCREGDRNRDIHDRIQTVRALLSVDSRKVAA